MMPRPLKMDPSHPVAGSVLRAMGGAAVAIDDAATALQAAEQSVGLGVMFLPRYEDFPLADGDLTDAAIATFLDATGFVVDGAAIQCPFALVGPEHRVHELSFRDWGHHVAAWANRSFPAARGAGDPRAACSPCPCAQCEAAGPDDWLYIDFYMHGYVTPFFADYDRWVECLERVVHRKVERFGAPFTR